MSLKARALRHLARREYSRAELERKLEAHARDRQELDEVLDALVAAGLLSNERFAESLVHRRALRFGVATVRREMRSHGLDEALVDAHVSALQQTELARARALWERRFGRPPASLAERARQTRFLLARGFSADLVRRIVGGERDDD